MKVGIRLLVPCLVVVCLAAPALAQQPGPSCQEQLLVKTTHDQLLAVKRAEVEDQLAQVAARANVLQQKIEIMTKQYAELVDKVKKLETPAAQEKPKE